MGAAVDIRVDVRVIGAMNRNLPEKVRESRFREDLFYRLNVLPIALPPLRDRADDVPLLVNFYVGAYDTEFKKRLHGATPDAMLPPSARRFSSTPVGKNPRLGAPAPSCPSKSRHISGNSALGPWHTGCAMSGRSD